MDELRNRCAEMAVHFSGLSGTDCAVLETSPLRLGFSQPANSFCTLCTCQKCEVLNTHFYGCSEASRWSGKYIYYCPLGLVFAASPVPDSSSRAAGGLIAGPMVMGELQDTLSEQLDSGMVDAISALPVFSTSKVNHLAEILAACTAYAAGMPLLDPFAHEQEKMLNVLYEIKTNALEANTDSRYFIESEKQLISLIGKRDKAGAQLLLNEMLGHIFIFNDFDFEPIKMRLIELAVRLSRSTIDAGADIDEILLFNANDMRAIEKLAGIEELSVWITAVMHRFINYAFDFAQVKHSDVVYKVMEYVKANYRSKISLDDVAGHVYLSRSYLSSVFKEETGESLFSYINKVRVEKSKQYLPDKNLSLLQISSMCGFEDQSYFTKVFKKAAGMSPGAFRNNRGRNSR